MKPLTRMAAIMAVGAVAAFVPAAAAQAASRPTVTLSGSPAGGYEFIKGCTNTVPYSCFTRDGNVVFTIAVSGLKKALTVSYTTRDGTAVSGEDYQAMSGQVTIQPNFPQAFFSVPLVNDGDTPGTTEQFSVVLTSFSQPVNLQGSAPMVIINGGNMPPDCNLARSDAPTISLTCTARPPAEQWQIHILCQEEPYGNEAYGNVVTGNGTSVATCPSGELADAEGYVVVSP